MPDRAMFVMLTDIRDRVIKIEAHMEALPEMKEDIKRHEGEIVKAKTQMRTMKWIASLVLVSIPTSIAAILRVLKG